MVVQQQILRLNHPVRPGGSYPVRSITIHSTGNPSSTAKNERQWLDNPSNTRTASWHYVVGEDLIIQAIPDKEEAWHCGKQEGNRYSISMELVESGNRQKVLENGAALVAEKLKQYGLTIANVKKHFDWTGKICPRILIDKTLVENNMNWDFFLKLIEKNLNSENNENNLNEEDEDMEKEKRFQKVEELPEWARPTIQKMVEDKRIADGNQLDLTLDMARLLVILNR